MNSCKRKNKKTSSVGGTRKGALGLLRAAIRGERLGKLIRLNRQKSLEDT